MNDQPVRRPATNRDRVLVITVMGEVASPQFPDVSASPYMPDREGRSYLLPRVGGIVYNVRVGDSAFGWAGDVIQPGVSLRNRDAGAHMALKIMASIGNRALVKTGPARGGEGVVIGKTGRFADQVVLHFPPAVMEEIAIGDSVQIYACGRGLAFPEYPAVDVKSIDPGLLESIDLQEDQGQISFPVKAVVPALLVGAGSGLASEGGSLAIQTTDPEMVSEHGLGQLRLGDIVAFADYDCRFQNGYLKDAVSIGVICHTDSPRGGYGPGAAIILTSLDGEVAPRVTDAGVNLVDLLALS